MASNKNQHFVPRVYFKPFTEDKKGVTINMFNIDRAKCIKAVSVKHQCSGDYFYGADMVLEKGLLHEQESQYSTAVAAIHTPGYRLMEEHRSQLLDFWLLQHLRTEASSQRLVDMWAKVGDVGGIPPDDCKLGVQEVVQMSMRNFYEAREKINDLKVCLVRNRTTEPFIISDDPAVMTNRWYFEDGRTRGLSPGLASSGALGFLPLSPDVLCLVYDGNTYNVAHKDGWISVKNAADVCAFNEHQFLNCRANIYFTHWENQQNVIEAFEAVAALRPASRFEIVYAIHEGDANGYAKFRVGSREDAQPFGRAIIHSRQIFPRPTTWPRILLKRTGGSVYSNGSGVGFIRHQRTFDIGHEGFIRIRL